MLKWLTIGVLLILGFVAYLLLQPPPQVKREPAATAPVESAAKQQDSGSAEDRIRKEAEEKARKEAAEANAAAEAAAEKAKREKEEAAKLEERLRQSSEVKERMTKIAKALQGMGSKLVEDIAPDDDARTKAKDLREKMNSARDTLIELKANIAKAEAERRSVASSLKDGRSTSERIGWRYASDPEGTRYPMSSLPDRRTKPVKYLYAEKTTKDDKLADASRKLEDLKKVLPGLESAKSNADAEYSKFCDDYKARLTAESRELASKQQELLKEAKAQ